MSDRTAEITDATKAFIMAEFLAVPYVTIIIAAIIPAVLYFATVYFMVHLEADKHGIGSIPREELPRTMEVLRRGWHLLIALVILIAFPEIVLFLPNLMM